MSHVAAYGLLPYWYLQGFIGNIDYAVPNATIPVAWIMPNTQQTDGDIGILTTGNGAIVRKIPNNGIGSTTSIFGGNKRGSKAVDLQASRGAADEVASGSEATNGGGFGCKAAGARSFAACDTAYALAAGSVAMGTNVTVQSVALYGSARGFQSDTYNEVGTHASSSGILSGASDSQFRYRTQRKATANNTATVITSDGGAASATNTVAVPNFSSMRIHAEIVARTGAGLTHTWTLDCGVTKQGAGTAAMVTGALVAGVTTDTAAGAAAWTISGNVSAAANNFEITATGAAATNIQWVAFVRSVEARF